MVQYQKKGEVHSMSENKFFSYKGFPLVRKGNEIYYGNMGDNEVVMLQIITKKKVGDIEKKKKIKLYRMLTDESIPVMERITKTAEKTGLYQALDIANAWLKRSAG